MVTNNTVISPFRERVFQTLSFIEPDFWQFPSAMVGPKDGEVEASKQRSNRGGRIVTFTVPDERDWALWLTKPTAVAKRSRP